MTEQPHILVVDDQVPNRKLLTDLLIANNYAVVIAESGEAALASIRHTKPDLVLLDVIMPGLDGYAVCRAIRADPSLSILPVVMVTALDPAEERIRGLDAGADDFISKPFHAPELLARVRSLLRIKTFHDTVQSQAALLVDLNAGLEKRVHEQLVELQRLSQLKRFFPPHLAERIVAGDVDDPLATHRREVTVAILDLRGFTALADTSEPEEVMTLLRRYHEDMGKIIQAHGGTLEQFSGSTMLIVFNDPVVIEEPVAHAVRMALDMRKQFDELMTAWRKRGHDIALAIGIAHGHATIGAIGYEARVGYGVIGRVTNLATRLSSEAGPGEILISASAFALVETMVEAKKSNQVNLAGFARPIAAYSINGLKFVTVQPEAQIWPLKIYALGQFTLMREGQPIAFSRKAQKRPLDLLKVLIAHGGVRADISALIASLWPDAEGDTAKVSFDSNLHRLRKLLDIESILTLTEGKLSLDSRKCWVDVWDFNQLVNRIENAARRADGTPEASRADLASELLRLYGGHFLEKESQDPWAVAMRDRLREKFVRAVATLGASLEQCGQWEQAATLYSRALELDNLAEGLYRRLMTSYRELGEIAEALKVYRRCRDMLSIVLGLKPSTETEAIHATLRSP